MKDQVTEYLKQQPEFRERKNKGKWIAAICLKKYGVELTPKLKDQLADLFVDMMNADRYWRMATAEHPELRGSDWQTGANVEQQYELGLGYSPNYENDKKALAKL